MRAASAAFSCCKGGGGRGARALRDGTGRDRAPQGSDTDTASPALPSSAPAEAVAGHGAVTTLGVTTLRVGVCDPAQHHGCFVRPQPAGLVVQWWHGRASLGEISVARIPAALNQPELWGWYHGPILLPCLRDADKFNFTT